MYIEKTGITNKFQTPIYEETFKQTPPKRFLRHSYTRFIPDNDSYVIKSTLNF